MKGANTAGGSSQMKNANARPSQRSVLIAAVRCGGVRIASNGLNHAVRITEVVNAANPQGQ